jgi:hypothetical protein
VAFSKIIQQNFQIAKKVDKLLSVVMKLENNINSKTQVDESFIDVINKINLIMIIVHKFIFKY